MKEHYAGEIIGCEVSNVLDESKHGQQVKGEGSCGDAEPSAKNSVRLRSSMRKRSKNFSVHDKNLALRLLHEYDPNDVLASLKWKPEVRAEKDTILTTIHGEFILEAERRDVTQMQVSFFLGKLFLGYIITCYITFLACSLRDYFAI